MGSLLVGSVIAYYEFTSMPRRFWFEGEVLFVEQPSGNTERFERWVTLTTFGFKILHAQSPRRTVRLHLCGYVKSLPKVETHTPDTPQTPPAA